jgi:hypothetical protein
MGVTVICGFFCKINQKSFKEVLYKVPKVSAYKKIEKF